MFEGIPENWRYDYTRVSSKSQESNSSIDSQKEELMKQGIPETNIRIEIGSDADSSENQPVFYNLIEKELKENDLLFISCD